MRARPFLKKKKKNVFSSSRVSSFSDISGKRPFFPRPRVHPTIHNSSVHASCGVVPHVSLTIVFLIAGTRDLPEVYQRTAKPDDMVVGVGVRETVATSEVKLRRVGSHVPFHVPVRSGLGHPM